jgi:hypothetical protein
MPNPTVKCAACGFEMQPPPLQSHILQDPALAVVVVKPLIIECKCGKKYVCQLARVGMDVKWMELKAETPSGIVIPPPGMKIPPIPSHGGR